MDLPPPAPNQPYIQVSALLLGLFRFPLPLFVADSNPTDVIPNCPALGFFLRHSVTEEHIVFDLGIRRNTETLPPAVQDRIKQYFSPCRVPLTAVEALGKGGVQPEDVKTVVVSHLHWDHIGDASPFTNATFILGGESEEVLREGYPTNPDALIDQNCIPADRTRFLSSSLFNTSIGPFSRAYDYYGDGSLYIIDAAGHLPGHINILARTSPDGAWIYLAGDTCHDVRIIMGERDIAVHIQPDGSVLCGHSNLEQARAHISKVRVLFENPHVEVNLAHDWRWYEAAKGIRNVFFPGIIPPVKPSPNHIHPH
ncbi:unnamed protein product [Somion occarium]|uniref:Metallo-beta-lactamase domain-containing protein n=1 Tax=Somion occarium TaxID=3059160 RepID=A0ABP1DC54_9APHY